VRVHSRYNHAAARHRRTRRHRALPKAFRQQ
jgi:hypothetical protein